MIRQALDTLPNCLPSSNTPTLVLITFSAVVTSPRFLPAALCCFLDYEDFIITVRFCLSTYTSSAPLADFGTPFPNDDAAVKLRYLALRNITKDWKMSVREWKSAVNQFAILFADRFMPQLQ